MAENDKAVENSKCIFCRIAHNLEPKSRLLHEDEEFVIFKDIKPAAEHHYLVVPKDHVKDPKCLGASDASLVERMVNLGTEYLEKVNANLEDSRFGFHWPPFNSIAHLHLHIISPSQDMGMIASFIFRPNSFWFVTAEWLLNRLKNLKG